jgi:hypothetical protein
MAASWVYNARGAHTMSGGAAAQGWSWGVSGIPITSGFLKRVRWYRGTAGSTNVPSRMQVWDRSTQSVIFELAAVPDDGLVGWQVYALGTDIPLFEGHDYTVSAYVDPGEFWWQSAFASRGAVGTDWLAHPSPAHTTPNASFGFPINLYNTVLPNVDMEWSDVGGGGGTDPGDAPSIGNDLAAWLDVDDFTEPDSMVKLSWDLLNTMETVIDAMQAKVDLIDAALEAALGPAGNLLSGSLKSYLDNLSGMIDDVQAAVGPFINDHTTAAKTEILTAIDAIEPGAGGGLTPLFDGGLDWTQADQTVGQGSYAWVQPADAYVIHVEDMAETNRSERAVGTEEIYWLRGWAKPWDGSRWGPEHIVVNGLTQVVQGVRRWDGIGFWLPPDVEWTITAYDYTP